MPPTDPDLSGASSRYLISLAPASVELFRRQLVGQPGACLAEQLDEFRHLLQVEEPRSFHSVFLLHRFKLQLQQQLPRLDTEAVLALPWEELDLDWLRSVPHALQLGANLRLPWDFSDLIALLQSQLRLPPELLRPRRPQAVLSAYFHQREGAWRVFAGVSPVEENISCWAAGHCRIPRDPQAVSRAEAKLLEAWEAFGLEGMSAGRALDLGAAPGGWSRVLAGQGYRVEAVDPAELDPRVLALPQVRHHRETAGSFLGRHRGKRFDLMVSDMKMEAVKAARLLVDSADALGPGGALLTTLKLAKGPSALREIEDSLRTLESAYEIRHARQLYFNRSEITVYARRADRARTNPS